MLHTDTDLDTLTSRSIDTVRRWLRVATTKTAAKNPAAERLSAVLSDPNGLDFTVGFVDRVVRTDDVHAAADALAEVGKLAPETMSALDRAQIKTGAALARALPQVVVPAARTRLRQMVGHMVVDARDKQFGKAVSTLTAGGHRLNINLLGEAVLGDAEADHHLEETHRLLAREDVDYVSVKVSSVASQISMWAFDDTVDYVVERLRPLYQQAAKAPTGAKFVNLDMEEYQDLELTIAVFMRLLSEPEFKDLEAGIVIQAYQPDALGAVQRLSEFAAERVANGGVGLKVRLVKGANLALETVHAEIAGWPATTCDSKQSTDANYKRVLHWLFTPERMKGLRIGVAGHNLFDIAFAHHLSADCQVTGRVEFEMLQGMASEQAAAVTEDVGDLLLYVPAVHPKEFDVAISYLVRRLEENSASENFMSGIFDLANGNEVFEREAGRFEAAVKQLEDILAVDGESAPAPNRTQDRSTEEDVAGPVPDQFFNEPDTDPSLPANQKWIKDTIAEATAPGYLDDRPKTPKVESAAALDDMIAKGRTAAESWRELGAARRGEILHRAAEVFAARRGEFLAVEAAEVGKMPSQSDPEVSEAIDFIRYYAHNALELEQLEGATFTPDQMVVVTPPWNFPIAIPTGGTVAALAAGSAVIHKPSKSTPHCSALIVDCLWEAGVPKDVLQLCTPADRDLSRHLVAHPDVDRVILTGASETAALFKSFRPDLHVNAETSGKNALVITPAADRDLAVADLVHSAFGHAGQKCSAASLAIMVGSTYDSERYRRQLIDAASSMIVDWPTNLSATMGPLTEDPSDKLERALTSLEPGESWLLEPKQLDDTGRLWSPGIKDGVKPGSFFHLTEVFGPVLGLMHARDLDEAIEFQNAVDFGLTGGIHSLDPEEVRTWLDRVQVGNAYVNRGITGAIVRRQSFGGWKQSSVGLGSKAGGPNYLMLFGHYSDDPSSLPGATDTTQNLELATADDERWLAAEFGAAKDPSGLTSEANIFRYRPRPVTLRVTATASLFDLERSLHAAKSVGSTVQLSVAEDVPAPVKIAVTNASVAARTESAATFAEMVGDGKYDDSVGARIRVLGHQEPELLTATAPRPEVAVIDEPVTSSGRVEMRYYVQEQAVSMTLHRFGNPSRDFRDLAAELKA
ncbi:bifunctional proline dehydrogenase/L-glutamate gamma-semialdehyde dehydrogenase [Brevibacterium sp. ZH18]|uniref:bifunctional proline dehydrogenase/L-glutamate gamma-semialdehyde dehydrogenase n=1 Tax=Brevibacterium sp. ZH18 TaxID=2927784 RepID=UPI001F6207BF|nr:bifunctional proline dehydrogenase/L-glutamate gamma-semialdehyde dehydrogenase [Brevibacterium sp. ZH18]MCI4012864.1 bifunctional proline dehydrogenase/L-glutamate gamma-semialdehyde dehydrogenase [Brevibacterium sp. ZH18]